MIGFDLVHFRRHRGNIARANLVSRHSFNRNCTIGHDPAALGSRESHVIGNCVVSPLNDYGAFHILAIDQVARDHAVGCVAIGRDAVP